MVTQKLVDNLRKSAEEIKSDNPDSDLFYSVYWTLIIVANEIEKELNENIKTYKGFPFDEL